MIEMIVPLVFISTFYYLIAVLFILCFVSIFLINFFLKKINLTEKNNRIILIILITLELIPLAVLGYLIFMLPLIKAYL